MEFYTAEKNDMRETAHSRRGEEEIHRDDDGRAHEMTGSSSGLFATL